MTVSVSFGAECQDGVALSNVDRSVCIQTLHLEKLWHLSSDIVSPRTQQAGEISIPRSLYMRPLAAANGDNVVTRQREWRPRLALT